MAPRSAKKDTATMAGHQISRPLLVMFISNIVIGSTNTRLPREVAERIADHVHSNPQRPATHAQRPLSNKAPTRASYFTPPATCMLTAIPSELRRAIFAESLPQRDVSHHPLRDDDHAQTHITTQKMKDKLLPRGPTTTLMVLNKRICDEIAELLYQERWFVIHVHEGLLRGGVEFLHAGRQPLHFQDSVHDQRFTKFTKDSEFGFHRLKKIRILIFPSEEGGEKRHTSINTYFMNLSLCRLLERSGEDGKRITNVTIEFVRPYKKADDKSGRTAIQRAEHAWWDSEQNQPRTSSIHNISHVELVLRPFANLTGCHAITISLPPKVASDLRIATFISDLEISMKSKLGTMMLTDDLEHNIESARDLMEEYVKFVREGREVEEMERMEMQEVLEASMTSSAISDDEAEGGVDVGELPPGKRVRSEKDNTASERQLKRRWTYVASSDGKIHKVVHDEDPDDEFAEALRHSEDAALHHEEKMLQQAIAASLGQTMTGSSPTASESCEGSNAMQGWNSYSWDQGEDDSGRSPFAGLGRRLGSGQTNSSNSDPILGSDADAADDFMTPGDWISCMDPAAAPPTLQSAQDSSPPALSQGTTSPSWADQHRFAALDESWDAPPSDAYGTSSQNDPFLGADLTSLSGDIHNRVNSRTPGAAPSIRRAAAASAPLTYQNEFTPPTALEAARRAGLAAMARVSQARQVDPSVLNRSGGRRPTVGE